MSDETMPGLQISTPYYAYDFSLPVADKNIGVHHSTAKFMIVISVIYRLYHNLREFSGSHYFSHFCNKPNLTTFQLMIWLVSEFAGENNVMAGKE